jgi:hypothetical protein
MNLQAPHIYPGDDFPHRADAWFADEFSVPALQKIVSPWQASGLNGDFRTTRRLQSGMDILQGYPSGATRSK